jgi:hypothetical protein
MLAWSERATMAGNRTFLALLLAGCAGAPAVAAPPSAATSPVLPEPQPSGVATAPAADSAPPPEAAAASAVAPASSGPPPLLQIIVEAKTGYEKPKRAKLLSEAVEIAQKVINDPEYQQVMRAYPSIHGLPAFTQATVFHGGAVSSNDQPMDALLHGNGDDGQIHLWLTIETGWKYAFRNEDGHTLQDDHHTGTTYGKGSAIDRMSVAQLAGFLVHEHMHRIGFQHADAPSIERCDSVPYAYGRTVCQFATKKYGLSGGCDEPTDWPPEQPNTRDPVHGPRC